MCFWIFKRKKAKEEVKGKEEVKAEKKPVEEKPAPKKEVPKAAPKKAEPKKVEPKDEKDKPQVKDIYHISRNNDEKNPNYRRWRVRKQGSQKTIQYFDTQAEAIKFAQDLADKVDGSIVIHKMDGTIRRQNY